MAATASAAAPLCHQAQPALTDVACHVAAADFDADDTSVAAADVVAEGQSVGTALRVALVAATPVAAGKAVARADWHCPVAGEPVHADWERGCWLHKQCLQHVASHCYRA